MKTEWDTERRRYFFDEREEGVAELVRAVHRSEALTRTLEAVYWWPEHEGPEWPAAVIVRDDENSADAWSQFEASLRMDERYRWEPLPD
jgi:hypothetical protein